MAKDAFETQLQVRQGAEDAINTLKDLRNWEKEIKQKEKQMKSNGDPKLNGGHSADDEQVPLRSDREKFTEYQSRVKRSKTVGDELSSESAKLEADTYKEEGNKLVRLLEYDNAIHYYEKAILTYATEPIYHANLAFCLLRKERYTECIESCTTAIQLNPECTKAFFRRAQAYESLNEVAKAIEDIQRVIQLEPQIPAHKRDLERLRQRHSAQSIEAAAKQLEKKVWLPLGKNQKYVSFIQKSPNYRSKKPMKRIKVEEVMPSMAPPVTDAGEKIPDAVIDKLFNNNTGECTAEPLPSRHSLDFGAFYRRKPKSPPKEQDDDLDDELPPVPTSGIQFYKAWKDLSPAKRFVIFYLIWAAIIVMYCFRNYPTNH